MSDHSAASSDRDAPTAAATAPVTVEQAAAILGVSVTTVKRRIRAGALRAEEARRPQGTVWLVYLPPAAGPAATSGQAPTGTAATAPTTTPAADAMAALIHATLAPIVAPLVAEQAALRQTVERQAGDLGDLRETVGRLTAELKAERQRVTDQAWELARADASRRREARRMALVLAVVATLALVAVAAPAWVR